MSALKWVVGIVVIALVGGGAYWFFQSKDKQSGVPVANPNSNLTTSPSDTSNQALDKDTSAIDAQLNGLESDSANAQQSVTGIQSL